LWSRPTHDLVNRAIGSAVTVSPLAIALLQEALIIALQLVVEDHAPNVTAGVSDLLGGALVRAVKVRIVRDLGAPGEAGVEALAVIERAILGRVQQVAATLGEGHERGPGTPGSEGTGFD
jgi:hypothetical protein